MLAFLILLFYGNTLANGFVHDDVGQIMLNQYVQSPEHLLRAFTGCIWESQLGDCFLYYRPIHTLSYIFTWQISSHPAAFHAVNLLYFFGVVALVFFVGRALTGSPLFAFASALIMIAHPLNSEVVNWVSAVPELTLALFSLCSLLFYIRFRKQSHARGGAAASFAGLAKIVLAGKAREALSSFLEIPWHQLWTQYKNLFLAAFFYFLAMLAKEPAVLLPALYLFLDMFVFQGQRVRRGKKKAAWQFSVPFGPYLALAVPFAIYFAMRLAVLGAIVQGSFYHGEFSPAQRIWAFVTLFAQYVQKFIFPYPSNFYYFFEKRTDFVSPAFLLSLVISAVFMAALVFITLRVYRLLGFFLFWTVPFLLPVLVFLNSTGENVFSERYAFLSTVGVAYAGSSGLMYVFARRDMLRWAAPGILAGILILSWAAVFPRNKEFKNDFTIYAASLEKNPQAHDLRRNLAVRFNEIGEYDKAIAELEDILRRDPQWRDVAKVYSNLGDAYRGKQEYERSDGYYHKALEISQGQDYRAYNNIGANFLEQGEYLKSLLYFCKAIAVDPQAPEPNHNFNRASSFFDSISQEGNEQLFNDVYMGSLFVKSEFERILFQEQTCKEETCDLRFKFLFQSGEIVLPFLIVGKTEEDGFVRPLDRSFDGPKGEITLTIPQDYKENVIQFLFPTCAGTYYEAIAS